MEFLNYVRFSKTYPLIKYNSLILYFHFNLALIKANSNSNLSMPYCPNPWPVTVLLSSVKKLCQALTTWLLGGSVCSSIEEVAVEAFCQRFKPSLHWSFLPGQPVVVVEKGARGGGWAVLLGSQWAGWQIKFKHLKKPGYKTIKNHM